MQAEAKRAATDRATIADQRQQIERLQRELADVRDNLDSARSRAAQSAVAPAPPPVISDRPVVEEPFVPPQPQRPSASTSTPEWYDTWRSATPPSAFERQQRIIEVVGRGEAFFRAEVVAALNTAGLLSDDPDRPGGTAQRLFTGLLERELIAEIDGGYGANVARSLVLTAQELST